jgi:hypothetical protein
MFWLKIIFKPKDSIVYRFYIALKSSKTGKIGTQACACDLLTKWNLSNVLDLENQGISYSTAIEKIRKEIGKANSLGVQKDVEAMNNSGSTLSLYK